MNQATLRLAAVSGLVRRSAVWRGGRLVPVAVVLASLVAVALYVLPGLGAPGAHWPLWDVRVYWWGGQQAARGGALYAPGAPVSFTYPPFAALLFSLFAGLPIGVLKGVLAAASGVALVVLCGLALAAAGVRPRPATVFALSAAALLTWPVAYTLHLGEVNLILAALVGADLLRHRDGGWWQGIGTGLAAGIKLTPLIFAAYLLATGRVRAAATTAGTFATTVAVGLLTLPGPSRMFWMGGVFGDYRRIGDPANPSDQSLAGALARLTRTGDLPWRWWLAAALMTGVAGLAVAAWAHRRGHRMAGVMCCAMTGLLVSPISWTHHWVWDVPLLTWLAATTWRRRSWWCGLAAAAAAAVFSGQIPITWAGRSPGVGRLLAGRPVRPVRPGRPGWHRPDARPDARPGGRRPLTRGYPGLPGRVPRVQPRLVLVSSRKPTAGRKAR